MRFKKYETKDEFIKENFPILLKEEAENEIIIGIINEHSEEKVNKWLLGRIENEDKVEAIFIVEDDKEGLVISFPNEVEEEVLEFVIDNIINLEVDLKEMLVPMKYADQMKDIYISKTNKEVKELRNTYTYKLEALNEECSLENDEKLIKVEDNPQKIEQLMKVVKEIHTDIYNEDECTDEEALRISKKYIEKGTYLLTNNNEDKVFTQVVNVRKQVNGTTVGAIITPKEFRGKGYGKKCVYAVCKKLLENNKFVALHVVTKNEAAIKVYERIGFKRLEEVQRILFL